jgi:maternal embryonic leucine zipper kinase
MALERIKIFTSSVTTGTKHSVSVRLIRDSFQVDPKKRITMRRLLSHRWLIKDHLAPVDPTSKYDDKTLDEELLTNIAIGLGWQRGEMRQELVQWKFDALTATYLLVSLLFD